jgi:hypothetical protein
MNKIMHPAIKERSQPFLSIFFFKMSSFRPGRHGISPLGNCSEITCTDGAAYSVTGPYACSERSEPVPAPCIFLQSGGIFLLLSKYLNKKMVSVRSGRFQNDQRLRLRVQLRSCVNYNSTA